MSAAVTFKLTVVPVLRRMLGWTDPRLRRVHATLGSISSSIRRPEYHRPHAGVVPAAPADSTDSSPAHVSTAATTTTTTRTRRRKRFRWRRARDVRSAAV